MFVIKLVSAKCLFWEQSVLEYDQYLHIWKITVKEVIVNTKDFPQNISCQKFKL